jgi:acetylornithine deacetylase/succinyl-diaminopimelate desuccinylase family protein
MDWIAPLARALDAHRDAILAFSEDLIRIPTENPPGRHYRECVNRIRLETDRLGLACRVLEAAAPAGEPRYNLLGFHGEGQRTVYFHGHYDVVPSHSPEQFTPRVEHGRLCGRGSADMKGGLAAMIYAACLLKELQVPLHGRIGLCIVADEETGGRGGSRWLEEAGLLGENGIAMLTPEPTGGVVWNASRGAITLRITVKGKAAHVGLQHQGVNAFERMVRVAAGLRALKAEVEERRTRYRVIPADAAGSILMLGGRVEGGANFNVVPERCAFTVERRFNPEEDLAAEKARLLACLEDFRRHGVDLDIEVLQEGHASGVPDDHPVARILAETLETVTSQPATFAMCPGLLETRWYAGKGIPAFAFGPGRLEVSHGPDEAVELEGIYQHTLLYALVAARLLG